MKMNTSFFKEYDIRGLIDKDLNAETAERIGKAFGTFIKGEKTVVGRDIRYSSKQIYEPFLKGLVSTGCNVFSIGESPSPMLYFNTFKRKSYGVIITASHNPAEYSGFKFVEPNGASFVDQYKEIKKIYEDGNFISGEGSLEEIDGYTPYKEFFKSKLRLNKKIRVVVECLYASGAVLIPKLYEEIGLEVIPSHAEPKEDFNNERPEPKGDNLKEMSKLIVENKADFGLGLDGDCDRSVIMDDKGRELNGSVSSAVFIKNLLPSRPQNKRNVVMTVDCNSELKPLVESFGGKLIWSEVGHGFIGKKVHDNNAVYGGEMSSHMWFEPFAFSDGFYCGLKMAELLSNSDKKLSQLADEINFAPMLKEYVSCGSHEKKEKVKEALVEKYRKLYPAATITRDGVKFFLNELEWVLLRKSNNLPEVCIVIEARNQERLKQLHKDYRKVVDETIATIK
jgi:phosphomannomutase/phosphoglucomutase